MLQYVAACCSVLQRIAVCLQRIAQPRNRRLEMCAVCCSVLQCVTVCYSVLQCVTVWYSVLQCVAVCCSALQCVAVCCSALQCVAVCLQRIAQPRNRRFEAPELTALVGDAEIEEILALHLTEVV